MKGSYIPENVYAICTFQMDAEPKKFIATRGEISVFYDADKKRPLLTVADKNIKEEFPCKSPTNAMWSFLAFGVGLLVGLALLSNPAGWVVLAVGAVAVASIGAGVYNATQIEHKCSGGLSAGNWKIEHTKVRINKEFAITQNSMLVCDVGGVLTPIFNYDIAKKYGQNIVSNNNKEVTLNAVASFFGGAGIVVAGAEAFVAGGWIALGKVGAWGVGTMAFVNVTTSIERDIIRENSMQDNEHYQRLNDEVDPNNSIPGYVTDPTTATPGDLGSPDILEVDNGTGWFGTEENGKRIIFFDGKAYIQDIKGNIFEIQQGTQLANDLKSIEAIPPRERWQNASVQEIVQNIRDNKYPESMIQGTKDGTGTVRPRDVTSALPDIKSVRIQNLKNLGKLGVKGGGLIAFFFPYIATAFSEQARKELVNAMMEDINNGINIVANNQ